jgi:carboxymethylenebutenolidase
MAELFARHMDAELAGDLETTLATMADNPHLVNVPSMVGGAGREGVRQFYANHLVGKFFPPMSSSPKCHAPSERTVS